MGVLYAVRKTIMKVFSPFNATLYDANSLKGWFDNKIKETNQVVLIPVQDVILDICRGMYPLVDGYIGANFIARFATSHSTESMIDEISNAVFEEYLETCDDEREANNKSLAEMELLSKEIYLVQERVQERILNALEQSDTDPSKIVRYDILNDGRIACEVEQPITH